MIWGPLATAVTLERSPSLSEPQFFHWKNEEDDIAYPVGRHCLKSSKIGKGEVAGGRKPLESPASLLRDCGR